MTKKKLIISLCAFVLVVAIGVVGVLAATQQTARITNIVSYTANNVSATVTFDLQRGKTVAAASAADNSALDADKTQLVDHRVWTIVTTDTALTSSDRVTINDAAFEEFTDYVIIYTFTVTNNANAGGIGMNITATPTATVSGATVGASSISFGADNNATAVLSAYAVSAEGVSTSDATATIAPGATACIRLTLTLTNPAYDVANQTVIFDLALATSAS